MPNINRVLSLLLILQELLPAILLTSANAAGKFT